MAVSEEDILYLSSQLEARLSAIQRENAIILAKLKDYKVAQHEGQRVNRHLYRRLMCTPLQEGRKNGAVRSRGGATRGRSRGGGGAKRSLAQRRVDEEGESEAIIRRRLMAQQRRLWKQQQQRQQQQQQRQQQEEEEEAMLQQHGEEPEVQQPRQQLEPQCPPPPQPQPQQQPKQQKPQLQQQQWVKQHQQQLSSSPQQQQQPRPALVQLAGVQMVAAAPSVTVTVPHVVLQLPAGQSAAKLTVQPAAPSVVNHTTQPTAAPAATPAAAPAAQSSTQSSAQTLASSTAKQRLEAAFKAFAKRTGPAIQQDLARSGGGALNQRTLAQELVKRWGQLSDAERKSYFAPL